MGDDLSVFLRVKATELLEVAARTKTVDPSFNAVPLFRLAADLANKAAHIERPHLFDAADPVAALRRSH
jgi:hypothetical protein